MKETPALVKRAKGDVATTQSQTGSAICGLDTVDPGPNGPDGPNGLVPTENILGTIGTIGTLTDDGATCDGFIRESAL